MPSASSYTNKIRVSAQARNVKIEYPGNVGNLTQSLLAITCNVPTSRWNSIEYVELCVKACKPKPLCPVTEQIFNGDGAIGVSAPCSILDGIGIDVSGTVVLDAGRECVGI